MTKSGSTPDPFDILNSELNAKAAEASDTDSHNARPEAAQNSEPIATSKSDHGGGHNTTSNTIVTRDVKHSDKGAEDKSGKSTFAGYVGLAAKGVLIAFLAALIAWIIFMPSGSLSELKEHVIKNIFGVTAVSGDIDNQRSSFNSDASTPTSAATSGDSALATHQTSAVAESTTTAAAVVTTTTATTTKTIAKTTTATKAATAGDINSQNTADVSSPYYIYVYLKSQVVAIYDSDDDVCIAFICSSGKSSTPTRTGSYRIHSKYRWRLMIGNCYTQYASSFSSGYLFHSIPYNRRNAGTMSNSSYDKLGTPASSGCIRLCFRDSKWIYDNCPIGTFVRVVDDYAPTGIVTRTIVPRIDGANYSGWDPTDTNKNNPYNN